jgi:hypothetical protein
MKYALGGLFIIALALWLGYSGLIPNGYGLLFIIALVIGGIFLIIHDVEGSTKSDQKTSFGIAWKLLSVKLLTLLSITFAVSLFLNLYVVSFDVASTNIQLRHEITNLAIQHQSEVNSLNQTVINLQEDNAALEQIILDLQETIDVLRQQETECEKKLRLYMVELHGNIPPPGFGYSWGSITFGADGVDHSVKVENNGYSIKLENNHHYIVKATKRILWFPTTVTLGELDLYVETQVLEKDWD